MTRTLALALLALAAVAAPATAAPVLGTETPRGTGTTVPLAPVAPSTKTVDGLVADWTGTATGFGGMSVRSAGELIYTDHLFDAWGADDGGDAERLAAMQPISDAVPETYRLEALVQNDPAGQFGIPAPEQLRYKTRYGDLERDGRADLSELRLAADGDSLHVLARTTTMLTASDTAVLLLFDTVEGGEERAVPFGSGLRTAAAEFAVLLSGTGGRVADLRSGGSVSALAPEAVAVNPDGFTNAIEARIPRAALAGGDSIRVAAATGRAGGDGMSTVANVAFRSSEPVREWFDKLQALALLDGSIDGFLESVDLAALEGGATERFQPGPGYHEKVFTSSDRISREAGEDGRLQHYGLFIPTGYDAAEPAPLQLWLHWRGGTAHSAGHAVPGVFRDLGEAHGTIVVSPRGRGSSSWYVGRGQVDVEEVWADVHQTVAIDARRRYVAGHSMGGWGSFLMTVLHPDWFAGALPASPPVTQGAWTGVDFEGCDDLQWEESSPCYIAANGGDPRAQHTRKLLENLRHVPVAIYTGMADELVPYTGVARQVERLLELGYRHRFYSFPAQEHFGPPVWDEWKSAGDYLHTFTAPVNPARVSYVRDMPFERATERIFNGGVELSFDFDRAYWMSRLEPRDATDGRAIFEGRSLAIAEEPTLTVPEASGPAEPGQTGPFLMTGLRWLRDPLAAAPATSNAFEVTLAGAAGVRLDAGRMALDTGQVITGTVKADGSARLSLSGFTAMPLVTVNGAPATVSRSGDVLAFDVPSGESTVVLTPPPLASALRPALRR